MTTDYRSLIRNIPDFPQPGIIFRDITPLLADADALRRAVGDLAARFNGLEIDRVVAIESRGFLLGAPVALEMGAGFVPVRKAGKLPHRTYQAKYELEYGSAAIEMHQDALLEHHQVLLVDDVLATGGTMVAAIDLVQQAGAQVAGVAVLIELTALNGRARLGEFPFHSVITY
jgi:adenine phosphoribosyltransferase